MDTAQLRQDYLLHLEYFAYQILHEFNSVEAAMDVFRHENPTTLEAIHRVVALPVVNLYLFHSGPPELFAKMLATDYDTVLDAIMDRGSTIFTGPPVSLRELMRQIGPETVSEFQALEDLLHSFAVKEALLATATDVVKNVIALPETQPGDNHPAMGVESLVDNAPEDPHPGC